MRKTLDNDGRMRFWDRLLYFTAISLGDLFFSRASGPWGFVLLGALLFFTSEQMTPGREWIELDWPSEIYYIVVGMAGAVAGFFGAQRRTVGLLSGMVAAASSLAAVVAFRQFMPQLPPNRILAWINAVILMIGLLPGIALYGIFSYLLESTSPEEVPSGSPD